MNPLLATICIAALVYRAYSHNSLTPAGILAAVVTATIHALHPWPVFFALLCLFFLAGTAATKVKADIKASLTLHESPVASEPDGRAEPSSGGGEGPRTHIQVLANSAVASLLILLHIWTLRSVPPSSSQRWDLPLLSSSSSPSSSPPRTPLAHLSPLLPLGIIANYAAVTADTLSSELGILSRTAPVLITRPWKTCARGTNGGVTLLGLGAGLLGGLLIAVAAVVMLSFGEGWSLGARGWFFVMVAGWGAAGSVLDSLLGATLQRTVVDGRTGKVVEGRGGREVGDGKNEMAAGDLSGWAVLDNNAVNSMMAALMSFGAIGIAGVV